MPKVLIHPATYENVRQAVDRLPPSVIRNGITCPKDTETRGGA
jgi:hypothetical protein